MGSFFGALAEGLGDYAKYRAMKSKTGQAIQGGFQQPSPALDRSAMENNPATAPDPNTMQAPPAPQPALIAPPTAPPEPMGGGKVVTTPTVALLGDKGPEAVVPLTDQPGNRVGTKMLGAGNVRTRYRHPQGPGSVARDKPLSADLPIRPNPALR